ncbi:hypothetical protein HYS28_00700 [Candidatus Uhrbacteria bacterium]|nr:hypothetical protein [Candidatus Uhrbacteria bacterium]
MRIMLATNNPSKVARVRKQLAGKPVEIVTPRDVGIDPVEIGEGSDIVANAVAKAKAYLGAVDMPVVGLDSSFTIEGEPLDPAKVRRNALGDRDESTMTQEEIGKMMVEFYQGVARRHGGEAKGQWADAFALVMPDGTVTTELGVRPVILTDIPTGPVDWHFPLRALYKTVVATGRHPSQQTAEEEWLELAPYREALERLLGL